MPKTKSAMHSAKKLRPDCGTPDEAASVVLPCVPVADAVALFVPPALCEATVSAVGACDVPV
jgi:hypothetical protein